MLAVSPSLDDFKWELYNIIQDFSQANNLAASEPTKFPSGTNLSVTGVIAIRDAWH